MKKLNDLSHGLSQFASAKVIPADHLALLIKETIQVAGVKIGVLTDISNYEGVAYVIYLVNERDGSSAPKDSSNNVCLMVKNDGSMTYELSTSLDAFWPIWCPKDSVFFNPAAGVVEEIRHFLESGEPKTPPLHELRDGMANASMHRFMRSDQKCKELKRLFGYRLIATDG